MTMRELNNQDFVSPWVNFKFNNKVPLKPKSVETWLERGGMPIFCRLSDLNERIGLVTSWLEAICYRDLKQLKDANYDSDIAYNIFPAIAADPMISHSRIAADLTTTRGSIKKHFSALKALFLIYEIPSFGNPRAQSQYRIMDAGVLNAVLGGQKNLLTRHASLVTLLIKEIYAQYEYAGKLKPKLYYYRTRGGAKVDLVLQTNQKHLVAIECVTSVDISPYMQRGMKSFLNNHKEATGYFIAPVQEAYKLDKNIFVIPWNSIG